MKTTTLTCDRCGGSTPALSLVAVREERGRLSPRELCPACHAELVAWLGVMKPPATAPLPANLMTGAGPMPDVVPAGPGPLGTFATVGQPSPGPAVAPAPAVALPRPLAAFHEGDEGDEGDELEGDEG